MIAQSLPLGYTYATEPEPSPTNIAPLRVLRSPSNDSDKWPKTVWSAAANRIALSAGQS
jgi:hypothetical protein